MRAGQNVASSPRTLSPMETIAPDLNRRQHDSAIALPALARIGLLDGADITVTTAMIAVQAERVQP